jgi:hypothetical protein
MPAARQNRSKLADTSSQALPTAPIFVEGNARQALRAATYAGPALWDNLVISAASARACIIATDKTRGKVGRLPSRSDSVGTDGAFVGGVEIVGVGLWSVTLAAVESASSYKLFLIK